jgi:sigma-B regulation protein RsbU (phosphoserine phosphatase)
MSNADERKTPSGSRPGEPVRPAQPIPWHVLAAVGMLVCGLFVTLLGWRNADSLTDELAQERFEARAAEIAHAIEDRVDTYEMALRGGLALSSALGRVSREQWREYVAALKLLQNYPGIQGLGYAPLVRDGDVRRHEEMIRAQGFPSYSIKPPGPRQIYMPIVYLEPFDASNQRAFGFDMFSEPVRRKAMERARDTGRTEVSGKVTLVQDSDEGVQAGFLMYLPDYAPGARLSTVAQRREALRGYVFSPFRMNDFMQGLALKSISGVGLEVHDGLTPSADALMFRSKALREQPLPQRGPMFRSERSLFIFGHDWRLSFQSLPDFEAGVDRTVPRMVLTGGLSTSLLLSIITFILLNTRAKALALATAMTAELRASEEHTRLILESTGEPLYGIDTKGNCTFCNPACARALGYASADDLLGRNMHALIHQPLADGSAQAEDCRIARTIQTGEAVHLEDELLWRADGTSFPAEHWSHPQRRDGEIVGAVVVFRDITERKRNAELLAAQRQRLANIIEGTNVGTWEWNVQTGELDINERWAEIIGYSCEELAPVGIETWARQAHPEDLKRSMELLGRHFAGTLDYYEFECRMRHKDGGWVWVLDRGKVATWTEDGKPLLMSGTHQDITKRKLAEADSAQLVGLINAASQAAIIATDTDGRITVFNRGAENMLGYTAEELVGLRTPELLHPAQELEEHGARLAAELNHPVEGIDRLVGMARDWGYEARRSTFIRKDGRHIPVELVITDIRDADGHPVGFLGIAVDISARLKTEQALRESEGRLSAILETAVDAIFTADQRGRILMANPAACQTFGYELDELVGHNLTLIMPEPYHSEHPGYLERYTRTGVPHIIGQGNREVHGQRKDGSIIPLEISVSEFHSGGERLFAGILRDISDRVRARESLEAANAELAARQKALDADLEAAAEIQRSLLPKQGTCSLGIEADFRFMPSATIGGDIFNLVCLGPEHTGLYMVDVSGHGVPAALVSVSVAQELSPTGEVLMDRLIDEPRRPDDVLRLLDAAFPIERFDKFFSMFYLVYEPRSGKLTYCNAGHPSPMLLRAGGGLQFLEEGGTLVGMGLVDAYAQGAVEVGDGDTLLMYTDGVTELESLEGVQFGPEQLEALFQTLRNASPEQVLQVITGKLQAHADGRPPDDDISLVCVRFSRM